MKKLFANLPIRLKLTTAIVAASFLVLMLFSSVFVFDAVYSFRKAMVNDISVMADLLSTNSKSALMLKKRGDATSILASLHAQTHIRSAYLFDLSGKPFAQYLDRSEIDFVAKAAGRDFAELKPEVWNANQGTIVRFDWSHLSLFAPIFQQEEKVGTIYLLSDNKELYHRIHGLLLGALLSLGLMVPFSLLLARYLTKPIASPLLNLVAKMATISQQSDFTIRAEKASKDEVGELVDGFNEMLTQIEVRDGKLSDHQKYLEETVLNRTKELQETVINLEKAKLAADSANQAKSQFLANMTHELRTPLIGVLGMNELLARTDLNDQQQPLVATVQRSGEDLLAMISDILDFSKIEAGHMRLENVEVDIFKVVEETTHLLAEKAYEKGLGISCQVMPAAMWKVRTDPLRIRQILLNLISNAVKFTMQGDIIIRLDMTMPGHDLGCFVLEVEDTGVGMSEEEQEKVFSAFVQADSTTTRQYGGTGLGLAIVHQLVALMGGELSLESRAGSGSRFRIKLTLPLVSNQLPQLPDSLRGRRVLLNEDCPFDRITIQTILSELGLQVVVASSVEDAWYRLLAGSRQGFPFDFALISTESTLPDGCLLYEKIRQETLLSGLRMIVTCSRLTLLGNADPEELPILEKPVLWSTLVKCLVLNWKKIELVSPPAIEKKSEQIVPSVEPTLARNASHYRILLADDNAVTRELVCLSLGKYPFEIDQVVSGVDALVALETESYDLILMDCNMPELDGMETTRRLREQGCHVPVVAMTAHIDRRIFESCKNAGMNDSLRKPFRQKELHDIIEKWLDLDEGDCSATKATELSLNGGTHES